MGNKEKKNTNTMIDTQMQSSFDRWNKLNEGFQKDLTGAKERDSGLRDSIIARYQGSNLPSGITQNAQGWFNLPEGEGFGGGRVNFDSTGDYGRARGTYEKMADTGGKEDFASALSSYENFINTGGLTGTDIQNMRYRATSQIPSFYESLKNDLARRRNVQGGYSPGFDAQTAELARQSGRESYHAGRLAESDITDRTLQGKMFGTQGAAQIGGLMSQNRLAGAGGLSDIGGAALQAEIANAQLGEQRSGRNLDAQLRLADMYQRGNLEGAAGLGKLYGTVPAETQMYLDALLKGYGGLEEGQVSRLGIRAGMNQGGGGDWWKNILGAGVTGLATYYGGRNASTSDRVRQNALGFRQQDFSGRNEDFGV